MTSPILPDVVDEARRLLAAADEEGLRLRLIGGVAVRLHVQGELNPAFAREIRDIDVVTGKGEGRRAGTFIEAQGYVPNRTFNAMHGARRMLFYDEANGRQLDVFVHTFEMCHVLPVGEHLDRDPVTVPPCRSVADEAADRRRSTPRTAPMPTRCCSSTSSARRRRRASTLRASPISARATGASTARCRSTSSACSQGCGERPDDDEQRPCRGPPRGPHGGGRGEPEVGKWKARARVGDRVRWYEEPDEVAQGGY